MIPHPFGAANWVTAARAVFAAALLAYALATLAAGAAPAASLRWFWVVAALAALALDGLDGTLARRLDQVSAFGARFDMETDAATMLGLAVLVLAAGQAGPWVLVGGLMRYIFVLGSWIWPVLAGPLPPRKRRQALCVIQMAALIVALTPPVPPAIAAPLCLAGLALLSYSFAVDVAWLILSRASSEKEAVV